MKEARYFFVPDAAHQTELPVDEAMHALRVLRLKGGDEIFLMDGPTKMMDRMEWFVEKATEIGVDEISFLNCKFSERKLLKLPRLEKIVISAVKQSHKAWNPVLHEMVSFKDFIRQPREGRKFIAHCYDEIPRAYLFDELRKSSAPEELTVMIGPEGDFSIDEVKEAVEAGYQSVHLGTSRLRTETAGLSAVMMMRLVKGEK